jgi:sugar phosphate isomerase/epimerase
MHPRLAVSAVSSWRWDLDDDLRFWTEAGVEHVTLSFRKLEAAGTVTAAERVAAAGLRVGGIGELGWWTLDDPASWAAQQGRLVAALDAAVITGAPTLVVTSGPAGRLGWDAALEALDAASGPVRAAAASRGVRLALEPTSPLRLDLSFVTTLRDGLDAAAALDVGVCVEVNSCFAERGLERTLRDGIDAITHVQLSDFVIGSHVTPDRAVPGDGDIPLEAILAVLLGAGYAGPFELELVGPRIEHEGYPDAIRRGAEHLSEILKRLSPS